MSDALPFFTTLFPGLTNSLIEFRFLDGRGAASSVYVPSVEDAVRVAEEPETWPPGTNVYFGVCPRSERKGDKGSIRQVHALWADIDAKDFPGGKPEALNKIRGCRQFPTIIVDSGNGYHAYWVLKTPISAEDPAARLRVELHLKSLAKLVGGDSKSAELARILRVPGTLNLKDPSSPRKVKVVELHPERTWHLDDFDPPATLAATPATPTNPPGWVAAALEGICAGNRNDTFTKLAGRLHGGGWTVGEILSLLHPHAEHVRFDRSELEGLVGGICRRYPTGDSLRLSSTNSGKPEAESRPLTTITAAELLDHAPEAVSWRVSGILPTQGVMIIAGPAGYGKSWTLLDLAVETTRGGKWLDHFKTEFGRVLYVDEESSRDPLGIRLRKLLAFMAGRAGSIDLHFCIGQGVSISDAPGVARLRALMETLRPNLVIVDSLIRVHKAEENSASDMAAVFGIVKGLVRDFGCAFVFADHQRKAGAGETSLDTMLRGSTEKAAFVDSLLSMKKTPTGIMVEHSKSRYAEPVPSFVISIEDPAPDSTRVVYVGETVEVQRQAMALAARPFLESTLADGDWHARKDILEKGKEAAVKEAALDATLKLMVIEGNAVRENRRSKSGRGNKAAHFRLIAGGAPVASDGAGDSEGSGESVFELPTISSEEPETDSGEDLDA